MSLKVTLLGIERDQCPPRWGDGRYGGGGEGPGLAGQGIVGGETEALVTVFPDLINLGALDLQ